MSDQDFVERLRIRWEAMGDMANSERAAAADEIEFLRRSQRELMGQVATLREERDEQDEHNARMDHILTRTANALHGGYAPPDCLHSWHDLPELVEKLRKERDEARRRVCEDAIRNGRVYRRVGSDTVRCETSKEVAEMMGWDCYKENKENTND